MVLDLRDICKSYMQGKEPVPVLHHIQLQVEEGEYLAIMGPSGSGKSTLMNIIGLLDKQTSGDYFFDGQDMAQCSDNQLSTIRNQKIGFVFQNFNLLPRQSVLENVALPLLYAGVRKKERLERAKEMLARVGLEERIQFKPTQLSGGQKQRVAIARALASDPQILLCDEATSALDPQTTSSILALLRDINKRFGITIVVITHQMAVVREICNRVAIMKDGQVVENGSTVEIFNHPKSEVARELLRKDDGGDTTGDDQQTASQIQDGTKIRIVFTENSAFEPVIANMILTFKEPINILKAATKNVGGVAKGEMILEIPNGSTNVKAMEQYLIDRGLELEELSETKTGGAF